MKYHLIGIAGVSMSGLKTILETSGDQISGCDLKSDQYPTHSEKHITKDLNGVIVSAAVGEAATKEIDKAKELKVPVITRAKMIGRLMSQKKGIAIAGMHGKTTLSSMITIILKESAMAPSFLIGGQIPGLGNAQWDSGEYFVVEACEYARQFLDFRPQIAVVTNIEEEHLDTYKGGLPEIKKAFIKFVKLLPKNGLLVLCQDDPKVMGLKRYAKCKVKTYSVKKPWSGLQLKIPGRFNLQNATAAARVCHEIGVSHQIIKKALNDFSGVKRRFEIKSEKRGVLVVDDYGHHPTEIKETLKAAKELYPQKRLICVFQPHQYLRTKALFADFAQAFSDCDLLILNRIYAVPGRDDVKSIDELSQQLFTAIKKKSQKNTRYFANYPEIVEYLRGEIKRGDLVLTMGATDIFKVGENLLKEIER